MGDRGGAPDRRRQARSGHAASTSRQRAEGHRENPQVQLKYTIALTSRSGTAPQACGVLQKGAACRFPAGLGHLAGRCRAIHGAARWGASRTPMMCDLQAAGEALRNACYDPS